MWAEEHAAVVCPAAPAAQHGYTAPVETVSDALVWAALEKRALQEGGGVSMRKRQWDIEEEEEEKA